MKFYLLAFAGLVLFSQCASKKKEVKAETKPQSSVTQTVQKDNIYTPVFMPGPAVVIYKTSEDYADLVAITLSDDKKSVVSYPDPSDINNMPSLGRPIALDKGYLWDQRGIGPNSAFIKMSYKEYASLTKAPSLETLLSLVVNAKPFTEMWNCGTKTEKTTTEALNALINSGELKNRAKKL
jgi:hypothetical protein